MIQIGSRRAARRRTDAKGAKDKDSYDEDKHRQLASHAHVMTHHALELGTPEAHQAAAAAHQAVADMHEECADCEDEDDDED